MDKNSKKYKKKRLNRLKSHSNKVIKQNKEKYKINFMDNQKVTNPNTQWELKPNAELSLPAPVLHAIMRFGDSFRDLVLISDLIKQGLIKNGGMTEVGKEEENHQNKEAKIVNLQGQEMTAENAEVIEPSYREAQEIETDTSGIS